MVNKVIISILVLLVILIGGLGYYSHTLNQQIDRLGEQLTAFEMEQIAQINAVSNELTRFRGETLSSVTALEDKLEDKIGKTMAAIDALEEEIGVTQNRIASLAVQISRNESNVGADNAFPELRKHENLESTG